MTRYHFHLEDATYIADDKERRLWNTKRPELQIPLSEQDVNTLNKDLDVFYAWIQGFHIQERGK